MKFVAKDRKQHLNTRLLPTELQKQCYERKRKITLMSRLKPAAAAALNKIHHLSFLPLRMSSWQNFEMNFLAFLVIATDSTSWNYERHLDISCTVIIIIIFVAFSPPAYLLSQALRWVYGATLTLKWVNLSNDWKCKWNTGARRWLKFKTVWGSAFVSLICLTIHRIPKTRE